MRLRATARASTLRALQQSLFGALAGLLPEPHGDLAVASERVAAQIAARWPAWIDHRRFATVLAGRLDPDLPADAALAEIWVCDLYLASAVSAGVAAAVVVFDRQLAAEVPATLRTVDPRPDAIDDVTQTLREKVLLPRDGSLRLASYSGHNTLGEWLRGAGVRLALTRRRRRHPVPTLALELEAILGLVPNADIRELARRHGAELRASLQAAVAALPVHAHAVMRLYHADRRSVEEIGRAHQVHVATVSRWLARARADITRLLRADLVGRLHVPSSEVDRLLGHDVSLELGLEAVLRSSP